jgi:parallel beta-helix repeat protein
MNTHLDSYFALSNDIDASDTINWNGGAGFIPVGTYSLDFSGDLDGRGHTISNLYINRPSTDYVGLFGDIAFGYENGINDCNLINASIIGNNHVGTIAGHAFATSIDNCSATGTVSGNDYVGGLIGYSSTWAYGSYADVQVTGTGIYSGGLFGQFIDYTMVNCHATGNVFGHDRVGGLVGYNDYYCKISNSYSTGDVSGYSNVGGFCGFNYYGFIDNSYSTGNVVAPTMIGGFVGVNSGWILNCYSRGAVTRAAGSNSLNIGSFVGYIYRQEVSYGYCTGRVRFEGVADPTNKGFAGGVDKYTMNGDFWDTQTTMQTSTSGVATGKTTAQMKTQSTYTGWNFASIWYIEENVDYPIFQWQLPGPVQNIDTGESFDTIQAAIDDTNTLSGHTITVANGTFSGNVTVDKAIHLIGDGMYNTTIIDAEGGVGIHVTADGATVSDFKIFNGAIGIFLDNVQNVAVSYVNTSHNDDGILLSGSDSNIIFDCTFYENGCGLRLLSSNSNSIYHNLFLFNTIQAYDDTGTNTWDDGYPSGGNYWSDYTGDDDYSGPDQDIPGSDGFGDTPYTDIQGGMGAQDRYPIPEFQTILLPIFATFCIALISWKRRRLHG